LEKLLVAMAEEVALARSLAEAHGQQWEDLTTLSEDQHARLIPLIETAFNRMRETSEEDKRERLRRSLATALSNPRDREQERFVRLVARYDELEVYILRKLFELSGGHLDKIPRAPELVWESLSEELREVYYLGQVTSITTALEADGLLSRFSDGSIYPAAEESRYDINTDSSVALAITPRGLAFMNFLTVGDARHPTSMP
jgi:hypothetical protein